MPLIYSSLSSSPSPLSSSLPSSSGQKDSSSPPSSGNRISPALLFIIVILSFVLFISGLIYLMYRFLMKHRSSSSISQSNRHPDTSTSGVQRQLQHLFHSHDSGLDQAFIDTLPVFVYKDIMGQKEPFDCAVCLCEFSKQDKLRLLPLCSHAFHIDCIDTWLLSNSTCPLCRGLLCSPGFSIENPALDFDDSRYEDGFSGNVGIAITSDPKPAEDNNVLTAKRVFSIRLGKFVRTNDGGEGEMKEVGETSESNLDARRCYSMGSFQYVVASSDLEVALSPSTARRNAVENGDVSLVQMRGGDSANSPNDGDVNGKKISMRTKGESFSISKIWLWSKKDKFPSATNSHISSSVNVSLPRFAKPQAA